MPFLLHFTIQFPASVTLRKPVQVWEFIFFFFSFFARSHVFAGSKKFFYSPNLTNPLPASIQYKKLEGGFPCVFSSPPSAGLGNRSSLLLPQPVGKITLSLRPRCNRQSTCLSGAAAQSKCLGSGYNHPVRIQFFHGPKTCVFIAMCNSGDLGKGHPGI